LGRKKSGAVIFEAQKRVAVFLPYWTFWESTAGGAALRSNRFEILAQVEGVLNEAGFVVAHLALIDSPESGSATRVLTVEQPVEAMLVLQTMAVPPSHLLGAIEDDERTPLLIWALQARTSLSASFDQSDITDLGATVGTPMLTSCLHRMGRPHQVVFGPMDPQVTGEVLGELELAVVAGALQKARLGRVGDAIPGYRCVELDSDDLESALGVQSVHIDPAEVMSAYAEVDDTRVALVEDELANYEVDVALTAFDETVRMAAALQMIDEDQGLQMGAMNCHVDAIRFSDSPGITPCFALGRETGRGIPWTCAGDVVTAIAMFVARLLGGAALYHEIEALDFNSGEFAIANSGEHDPAWGPADQRLRLQQNPWYSGDPVTGGSVFFELPPGPATLVAFTPSPREPSGYRFVTAEGEVTDRRFSKSPTVGGAFRFASSLSPQNAWKSWVEAGVNHHSALAPGHLARAVDRVAGYLGVGFVAI
jgi:L-arabinose isomerase